MPSILSASSYLINKNYHNDSTYSAPNGFGITVYTAVDPQLWYVSMITSGATWTYVAATDLAYKIPTNSWTLLSLVYDGSTLKGYFNGILACSTALSGTIDYGFNGPWNICGKDSVGTDSFFNGKIDDVRIESVARSSSYLVDMYNNGIIKIDRLWNRTTDTAATKIAVQNTPVNMPIWTENDPDFNNKGSLALGTNCQLLTGTLPTALPTITTHYYVVKLPMTYNDYNVLLDGNAVGRQIMSCHAASITAYTTSPLSGPYDLIVNTNAIVCIVFNGASSAIYKNNATTAIATGTLAAVAPTALSIGSQYADSTVQNWLGKVAHVSIYDGAHTTAQRTLIMQKLGTKFGPLDFHQPKYNPFLNSDKLLQNSHCQQRNPYINRQGWINYLVL